MKTEKKEERTERQIWHLAAGFILVISLYALLCYPIYTGHKTSVMKQLYRELQQMELSDLDEDDIETLNEFQREKFEILVVNEQYEVIYTSRTAITAETVRKRFENKLEQYGEKPSVERKRLESRQVLVLRGKVLQNSHSYLVYIRKDVQSGLDIIEGTVAYFSAALLLITLACYRLARKKSKELRSKSRRSEYQLLESQREFVANISHELKTPLAVVSSQVEMLEIAGDKINRSYYYASIREELDKMSKMVGELLDFSMLDNQLNVMKMGKVNVSETVSYLMLRYDALFRKNGIKVQQDIQENCMVYGNRMYLERAVNNYLMNAFQHTQQGKGICVTLKKEGKQIRLEVYNDGEPIPQEKMDQIWDSFYTSARKKNPSAEDAGNIGLGLFTVRKIIESHKGRCGAENQKNGVMFWIELPMQ